MMGYGWYGNALCRNWFGFGRYGIWSVLIVVGLLAIVLAVVLRVASKRKNGDAVESLKRLYVKGEISEEEYLKRKSVIERKR